MPTAEFEFRRVEERDVELLHDWFARPHVVEWWSEPPATLDQTREEYLSPDEDGYRVDRFIAWHAGRPVGFIQSYAAGPGGGWWPRELDPGVVGTDQFLANADQLGRGLGTAMLRAFTAQLLEDPATIRVITDPDPANARAIRCYEKAGFRRFGEVDTPDGRALLMVQERG